LKFLFSLAAHILKRKTITGFNQILLFFQNIGNEWNSQQTRYIVQGEKTGSGLAIKHVLMQDFIKEG
jgi:hypothetical protein